MENLNNIIKTIDKEASKQITTLQKKATEKKQLRFAKVEKEAKEKAKQIIAQAEEEGKRVEAQCVSKAQLQVRNEMLRVKGELIEQVKQQVLHELTSLNEEMYVHFLQNHLKKVKIIDEAQIIVPKDKQAVVKKLRLPIQLNDRKTVSSGFQIEAERMTINFSMPSILSYYEEKIQRFIVSTLFTDEE